MNEKYVIIDGRKLTIYPSDNNYQNTEELLHDHKQLTKLKGGIKNE